MADIRLAKPAAGASETVPCAPEARFVFDFPATDATLARDGDNLAIQFEDGSRLNLEGFYTEYNEENLPSFSIDGTEVAAADFFAAMNEPDLMPAAGPGAGTPTGGRFHEWGDASLADGIDHLNGLDWGFSRAFEWEDHPNAVGGGDDEGGLLAQGPANTVPGIEVPVPGEPEPEPDTPGNSSPFIPNTNDAAIVVDEGALEGKGSGLHKGHGAKGTGDFVADVHDEAGGSIELSFGETTVRLEIPRDGTPRIDLPEGTPTFTVNGVEIAINGAVSDGNGKWTVNYSYELKSSIYHDAEKEEGQTKFDSGIAITVTDGSGDVAEGRLSVEVHDDGPVITVDAPHAESDHAYTVTGTGSFNFGADDAWSEQAATPDGRSSQSLTVTMTRGDETFTATVNEPSADGTFTFELVGDAGTITLTPQPDTNGQFSFTYTTPQGSPLNSSSTETLNYTFDFKITDVDGDEETAQVGCTIRPTDMTVIPTPETPETPFEPDSPDINNIVIGSTTDGLQPATNYNMAFLFDLAGSSSVKHEGHTKGQDWNSDNNKFNYIDYKGSTEIINTYTKTDDHGTTQHYAHLGSNDENKEYYDITELHNSTQNTIEYIKSVMNTNSGNGIPPDSTVHVLLAGFDLKIESALEFTITRDGSDAPTISVRTFESQSPTLKLQGENVTLGNTAGTTEALFSQPETVPEGDNVNHWLDGIFTKFMSTALYNLNSAFSSKDCAYTYAGTNIDNALGLANGWFHNLSSPDGLPSDQVINKTFLLSDGGPTAHNEPVKEGSHTYYNNWQGGAGNKYAYDIYNIKDYWIGDTDGHWASSESGADLTNLTWADVAWEPGHFAVVKVGDGNEGTNYLVINQLGLVCGTTNSLTAEETSASQLKYIEGSYSNGAGYKTSIPVVMDWVQDKGYFGPCLATGNTYHNGPGGNNNTMLGADVPDGIPDIVEGTNKGANDLKETSSLTVIKFGNENLGGDLDGYASTTTGGAADKIIMGQDTWQFLPEYINSHLPHAVNDVVASGAGDDILFGDAIAPGEAFLNAEKKFDSGRVESANVAALAALAGLGEDANPAEISAKIWNNSDEIAGKLDQDDSNPGGSDTLIGGADNDLLYGMNGNDVLFGDGGKTSPEQLATVVTPFLQQGQTIDTKADALVTAMKEITGEDSQRFDQLGKAIDEKFSDDAEKDGNDKLCGGNGDDVLLGMGGDDRLMGGAGDDYLFGGAGNDYLDGGKGKDYLHGGAGSDLLVYDAEDYLIDGGAGLDILLAGNNVTDSLDSLLKDGNVQNVEVLLKGEGAMSLTRMEELAEKYGIEMSADGNSLTLTMSGEDGKNGWKPKGDGVYEHVDGDGKVDLTMETANLTVRESDSDEAAQAAQTLTLSAQG